MRFARILTALMTLIMAIFLPLAALAQGEPATDLCKPPRYFTDVRPDHTGPPTEVVMGVRVADLLDINDVDQTIKVDMAMRLRWQDPRLVGLEGCRLSIHDIWFPQMILKNSGRLFSGWPETVSVDADSTVTYLQRMSGTFASYHHLGDFPFDEQVITLRFYPLDWSSSKLVLKLDETFAGIASTLNISDWDILDAKAEIAVEVFGATGQEKSAYLLNISAERHVGYYIWKIMVPIALIVFMSTCVFWIDPTQFGTQIGLSATSVLTIVAFIFGTTSLLPRLGYVTLMDMYILAATVFVFLALLVTIVTGYLAASDRNPLAMRIDLLSRRLFPVGFVVIGVVFVIYAR